MWTLKSDFDDYKLIFIIWPKNLETWRKNAKFAQKTFKKLIKTIAKFDKVLVAICDSEKIPFKHKNVSFIYLSSNDSWARDTAPLILKMQDDKDLQSGAIFKFDAYNKIYKNFENDKKIATKICKYLDIPYKKIDLIMEGGGIVCNGQGVAIITEELLLNRKNSLDKSEIEKLLKKELGLKKIVFLKKGLCFDETAGHADEIVSFCNENEIAFAWTEETNNPNFQRCRENFDILKTELPDFTIHKVILPNPLKRKKTESISINPKLRGIDIPISVSYINYLCGKKYIIVPQFKIPEDKIALKQLRKIYPNKIIIPFYSREIALGGGGNSLHYKKFIS